MRPALPTLNDAMHKTTKQLRAIMRKHQLTCQDVADITNRKVSTVHVWRSKHPARIIPAELLSLVELTASTRAARQGRAA